MARLSSTFFWSIQYLVSTTLVMMPSRGIWRNWIPIHTTAVEVQVGYLVADSITNAMGSKIIFEIKSEFSMLPLKNSKTIQVWKTDLYFLQFFQTNTTVCLIIYVFCKNFEPKIVLKIKTTTNVKTKTIPRSQILQNA